MFVPRNQKGCICPEIRRSLCHQMAYTTIISSVRPSPKWQNGGESVPGVVGEEDALHYCVIVSELFPTGAGRGAVVDLVQYAFLEAEPREE